MGNKIKVKYFGQLRDIIGTKEEWLEIEEDLKLLDVLKRLNKKHGEAFEKFVFKRNNSLNEILIFLINGVTISTKDATDYLLKNEDTLSILIPIFGG
ncbi:MAG: MoaD/ThiS family protein [Promethearchaeota archaeon]